MRNIKKRKIIDSSHVEDDYCITAFLNFFIKYVTCINIQLFQISYLNFITYWVYGAWDKRYRCKYNFELKRASDGAVIVDVIKTNSLEMNKQATVSALEKL